MRDLRLIRRSSAEAAAFAKKVRVYGISDQVRRSTPTARILLMLCGRTIRVLGSGGIFQRSLTSYHFTGTTRTVWRRQSLIAFSFHR